MRRLRLAPIGLAFLLLFGCTALPEIEAGVCGNAVLEKDSDEDCDTFVERDDPDGAVCRPKGVVGACHYDCQLNADNTRAVCPDGMGCSPDGLCRRVTDDFAARVKLSSDPASWLSTVDFDGDGRLELLSTEPADQFQQAHFRLHYFDLAGNLAETRTFPRVATRPIARKLANSDTSDLIFSNFRIGMLPGRADRDWVPATFSSYAVPNSDIRVVGMRDDAVGGASPLAALTSIDGVWGIYVPSILDDGQLSRRARLARPVRELAGPPIAADIDPDQESPCHELVYAFRGEDRFRVLDMCRVGEPDQAALEVLWRDEPREQLVSLPAGLEIDAGPLAADVDGDGHVDVLLGASGKVYVAYGDGNRLEDVAEGPLALSEFATGVPFELPMPLAAGDISGDGKADFVLPEAVLTSRRSVVDGSVGYITSYPNSGQPWSMAEIAHLNADALPDVVLASAGAPGFTFLNGTGGPYQVSARLGSSGAVRFLTTGDFDGDGNGDVAFIEDGPPSEATAQLSLAFGASAGKPLPAKRVAALSGVEQLSRHHDRGFDTLFAASREVVNGKSSATLTLFDGGPDRLPFAPYTLVSFSQDHRVQDWAALALAVGNFTGSGANDVVALGANEPDGVWNLWLVPNIGGEKVTPRKLSADTPSGVHPFTSVEDGTVQVRAASAAADLEGDGFDEALWLVPRGEEACVLLRYDIDGGANEATVRSQIELDEPCPTPELATADLNGDEHLDLLLLVGDPKRQARRLEVLWNDRHGGFSVEQRTFIADPQGADVRAFSIFPAPSRRIAFVTAAGLRVASTALGGQPFEIVREVAKFDDARAVTVTDSNADRVSDIAVADAEGLWLVGAKLR